MNMTPIALAAALSFCAAGAQASTIILDQSFESSAPVSGAYFNEGAATIYDDFTVAGPITLNHADFWGVHWSSGAVPAVEDFVAELHQDSGGSLGALIGSSALTIASRTDTGIDHNAFAGADIYEYSVDFVSPFALGPGGYWISIYLATDAPGTTWAWQRVNTTGASIGGAGDVAVVLSGDVSAVPLPASALLLLGGVAGLGALRRRRG